MKQAWLLGFLILLSTVCWSQKKSGFTPAVSSSLRQKMELLKDDDSVSISVSLSLPDKTLISQFRLVSIHSPRPVFKTKLSQNELTVLQTLSGVSFINEYHQPKEELNTGAVDYTLNKVNLVHYRFPHLNGDSLMLSVKERRFDSSDIDLRGRVVSSGVEAPLQTPHASLMATIIAGAGNSSPFAKGVATGSLVSSADFTNLFPETDALYQQKEVTVQSHSYGTVVENFYGNEAVAYDRSVNNTSVLLHVFSAGNAGATTPATGPYAGIPAMANLSGNFKQSKNTIAVSALDSSASPMAAASRGPAYDGRLKPELAAYGEDGSSGAAALVSGTAALLQQAYKSRTGQVPTANLVKSILLNSADDVGPLGIDYLTGYGSLNASKAAATVVQSRFWQNSITQGETKLFPLAVPANMARLKLTLTWTDPAAQPGAAKALVNDLDLVLRNTATGEIWEPWVLNAKPNRDSLLQPPLRKKDTLNNVEQITLDVPASGSYQVEVKGEKVSTTLQAFAVSYQFDTSFTFNWTYPLNSETLLPEQTSIVRWNTTFTGTANLELSFNRTDWRQVASAVNLSGNQYRWTVPDTIAVAFLRMSIGGNQFLTDSFVISPQISLNVGFVCADSFQLNWKKLPVGQYRLYGLGEKYLEPLMTLTDTAVVFHKTQHPFRYYSVAPLVQTKEGWRSNTIPVNATGTGCYFLSFYLQLQTPTAAFFTSELGTLYNVKEVHLQKRTSSGFVTIQTIRPSTTLLSFSDLSLLKGENAYRLQLVLQNGSVVTSQLENVYHYGDNPVYLYPNPVGQHERITIIATEAGRFTLQFMNASGVEVYRQFITSSLIHLPANRFTKGMYFVRVLDKLGKSFIQKLIIQ